MVPIGRLRLIDLHRQGANSLLRRGGVGEGAFLTREQSLGAAMIGLSVKLACFGRGWLIPSQAHQMLMTPVESSFFFGGAVQWKHVCQNRREPR